MNNNLWATNFSGNFVAGHNEHDSYWWGSGGLLGGCGDSPGVTIEATQIPTWLLLAAGVWAVMMLMKKR